jgi:hypothetical protein
MCALQLFADALSNTCGIGWLRRPSPHRKGPALSSPPTREGKDSSPEVDKDQATRVRESLIYGVWQRNHGRPTVPGDSSGAGSWHQRRVACREHRGGPGDAYKATEARLTQQLACEGLRGRGGGAPRRYAWARCLTRIDPGGRRDLATQSSPPAEGNT